MKQELERERVFDLQMSFEEINVDDKQLAFDFGTERTKDRERGEDVFTSPWSQRGFDIGRAISSENMG